MKSRHYIATYPHGPGPTYFGAGLSRSGRGTGCGPKGQEGGAGVKQPEAAEGLTNSAKITMAQSAKMLKL
jgi:hypothetical protein